MGKKGYLHFSSDLDPLSNSVEAGVDEEGLRDRENAEGSGRGW